MKKWDIVQTWKRAQDIEMSQIIRTARSRSWSVVGLTAERLHRINFKAKVNELFGHCLYRSLSHVEQVTNLFICSPLLQGIVAIVARWSGEETHNLLFTNALFLIFKVYDIHLT